MKLRFLSRSDSSKDRFELRDIRYAVDLCDAAPGTRDRDRSNFAGSMVDHDRSAQSVLPLKAIYPHRLYRSEEYMLSLAETKGGRLPNYAFHRAGRMLELGFFSKQEVGLNLPLNKRRTRYPSDGMALTNFPSDHAVTIAPSNEEVWARSNSFRVRPILGMLDNAEERLPAVAALLRREAGREFVLWIGDTDDLGQFVRATHRDQPLVALAVPTHVAYRTETKHPEAHIEATRALGRRLQLSELRRELKPIYR